MRSSVPPEFVVLETEHWTVNHRIDSRLPGYLIVGARDPAAVQLWQVPPTGLAELGPLLANCTRVLTESCGARRVYVGRYGHDAGWPVHFHVVPVHPWIEDAYVARHGDGERPDGVDLTRFVMREYCEGTRTPFGPIPSVDEMVRRLRRELSR